MALYLVALAQLAFALLSVSLEALSRATSSSPGAPIPQLQILLFRMVITYAGATTWMRWQRVPFPFAGPPEVRGLLVARGVGGFLGLFAVYHSLGYLTQSDSTTLSFLTPFFTGSFAQLFLAEPFTRRESLAAIASLAGVVLIARPSLLFGGETLGVEGKEAGVDWGVGQRRVALGVGLLGVAGAAAAYTVISAIGRRAHAMHMVAYLSGVAIVACLAEMIIFQVPLVIPPTVHAFSLLCLSGLLGCVAQCLLSFGLQDEKAARASLLMYLQILFSGVVDRLAFVHPAHVPFLSFLGSVVILASTYYGTFAHKLPSSITSLSAYASSLELPLHSPSSIKTSFFSPSHSIARSLPSFSSLLSTLSSTLSSSSSSSPSPNISLPPLHLARRNLDSRTLAASGSRRNSLSDKRANGLASASSAAATVSSAGAGVLAQLGAALGVVQQPSASERDPRRALTGVGDRSSNGGGWATPPTTSREDPEIGQVSADGTARRPSGGGELTLSEGNDQQVPLSRYSATRTSI